MEYLLPSPKIQRNFKPSKKSSETQHRWESQFQYARAVCSDTAACDDIKRTRQELVLLQYREMGDENFMIAFSLAVPYVCVSEFEIPTVWGFQGVVKAQFTCR